MLRFFKRISLQRAAWIWLIVGCLILELIALYFQHVMKLIPCVLCVYERCAVLGILAAGLLGSIAPGVSFIRYGAILVWLYSAWEGVRLSWEHTMKILHPNPFDTCDFIARFPDWLPLGKWLPMMFQAQGDCSVSQWRWLSLEMPQWLLIIFSLLLLIAIVVAISQFVKLPRRDFFSFR